MLCIIIFHTTGLQIKTNCRMILFSAGNSMKRLLLFLLLFFSFCAQAQIEKAVPDRPNPPRLVNDYTQTLTPEQIQALEQKLVAYNDSTSSQIALVIISSLEGYDISDYGLALGRKWQVGGKEFNNGIV